MPCYCWRHINDDLWWDRWRKEWRKPWKYEDYKKTYGLRDSTYWDAYWDAYWESKRNDWWRPYGRGWWWDSCAKKWRRTWYDDYLDDVYLNGLLDDRYWLKRRCLSDRKYSWPTKAYYSY